MLLAFVLLLTLRHVLYPFLAVTDRVSSQYVVAEGWLEAPELRVAAGEFARRGYIKIITSGGRVMNEWTPDDSVTYADWGASKLERIGVPTNLIQRVPCFISHRDRTYNSALAVKNWFTVNHIPIQRLDVFTEGAHARRTRLLYQKAFGDDVQIGIIAIQDPKFDPHSWWRTSEGVREVVGEAIAYLYARFFFHPSKHG
jgi:hypothetical protein